MKVVVFAKPKPGFDEAMSFLRNLPVSVSIFMGSRGDLFPKEAYSFPFDMIISYMSPWIIPSDLLAACTGPCINFHPGPPEYPGTGCTNFALYNREKIYGVTAHLMEPSVDTGRILKVDRFPVYDNDTVFSLSERCYSAIRSQFCEVAGKLVQGDPLICEEKWTRRAYLRRELNDLCRITPDMSEAEVQRRLRATVFPGMPGPYIEIHGVKFFYREGE